LPEIFQSKENPRHTVYSFQAAIAQPLSLHYLTSAMSQIIPFYDKISQRYGMLPNEVMIHKELRDIFLPILRNDISLVENYNHKTEVQLHIPLFIYYGNEDRLISKEMLADWKDITQGRVTQREFPDGHFVFRDAARTCPQQPFLLIYLLLSRQYKFHGIDKRQLQRSKLKSAENEFIRRSSGFCGWP